MYYNIISETPKIKLVFESKYIMVNSRTVK